MTKTIPILSGALCLVLAAPVAATEYAYPARGQSAATQRRDENACHAWAVQHSGYDPAHPPVVAAATPAPVTGSGARVRGAAVGAVGGAIGGNAGAGALAGAAAGGILRRARNRRAADEQNAATAQQLQAARAGYDHARAACLTGRGYTVK